MVRVVGVARWGVVLLVALAGCRDSSRVVNVEATALFDQSALDFGEVPVGEWRETELKIRNVGDVPFNAVELLRLQNNPSYEVELDGPSRIGPGEERPVKVRFHPLTEGDLADTVFVDTDAEHKPEGKVPVRGKGVPTPIDVYPAALDFQVLEVDSDRTLELLVRNPVDLPLTVRLQGESAGQFDADQITIPPKGVAAVRTRYFPRAIGQSAAKVEVRSCEGCTPTVVDLSGRAVPFAFAFDPEPVPFDNIPVHERTQSKTKATNITWRPVKVSELSTSDPSFVALTALGGRDVGPGESVDVSMEFAARYSGPATGTLTIGYTSDKTRAAQVMLDARGGRPQLALTPTSIDFGDLPVGGKLEKVVRLTNAGTNGALHFQGVRGQGQAEAFGVNAPKRGKTVLPVERRRLAGAHRAGVSRSRPAPTRSTCRCSSSRPPRASSAPSWCSSRTTCFNPERVVVLTGRAHTSGPCVYRIHPTSTIDFGTIEQGRGAVLGFYFENVGAAECAVKNIRVSNSSNGSFFMPGGEIAGGVLAYDTSFSAMVAFRPTSTGAHHGEPSSSR